ncbi:bacteriophage abortive infection AbiH family protein [Macellibacteroides fermentans]|uniref:bacteriophage abortive infection AbiH family protein n=1 Tax=Macellibacteroides fermentans TaxID=879969 RepID=UPI003B9658C0
MGKTLYIIGNGFDRYHGLDTSYQSFAFFLQDKHEQIHDYLINYYNLPYLDRDNILDDSYYQWSEFENKLASLEFQEILDDNTDYLANPESPDFRDRDWHAYQFQMEKIVDDLTENLFKAFKEFILKVEFPETIKDKKLYLNKSSIYLNFNYTNTLERYYDISTDNILYIHKKANNPNDTLILGHGINPDNFSIDSAIPEPPEDLSDEEYDEWEQNISDNYDFSYETGKDELLTYFLKSFKKTEEIIQNNDSFFQSIQDINGVVVLGHSLSGIDKPYLTKVFKSIRNKKVKWTVSYFTENEKVTHKIKLIKLGLSENQIDLIKISNKKATIGNYLINLVRKVFRL